MPNAKTPVSVEQSGRRRVVSGKGDAETGAIFAYESVIESQLFSNQLMFHFQDTLPVRMARFTVTPPPSLEAAAGGRDLRHAQGRAPRPRAGGPAGESKREVGR